MTHPVDSVRAARLIRGLAHLLGEAAGLRNPPGAVDCPGEVDFQGEVGSPHEVDAPGNPAAGVGRPGALNQMRERDLSALRAAAAGRDVDWVEVRSGPDDGVVRLQRPSGFETLLKLEYGFETHRCRLLVYRQGSHAAGRCGIRYDDAAAIDGVLAAFARLLREACAADGGAPRARCAAAGPWRHPVPADRAGRGGAPPTARAASASAPGG